MSGSRAEEVPSSSSTRAAGDQDFPGRVVLVSRVMSVMVVGAYLAPIDWSSPPSVQRLSWVLVLGAIVCFPNLLGAISRGMLVDTPISHSFAAKVCFVVAWIALLLPLLVGPMLALVSAA